MTKNYLKFHSRILIVISFTIFSWIGLSFRLFQVQVIDGSEYRELGFKQAQAQLYQAEPLVILVQTVLNLILLLMENIQQEDLNLKLN